MQRPLTTLLLLLTAISATAQSPPGARFSGNATLQAAAPASADGRFSTSAELQPATAKKIDGRFRLDAQLKPQTGAKVIATACAAAGVTLFSNGFEN